MAQHLILTRAVHTASARIGDYAAIARDLRAMGVRPPCLVTGRPAIPVGYHSGCASAEVSGHNENTTRARIVQAGYRLYLSPR